MEDGIMDDGGLEGCIEEMRELVKDKSPYLGMEFPSEEIAYEFYNEYRRIVGFGIRKDYCNKSKKDGVMTSRKFVCDVQGMNIDIADDTGISLKALHDLISVIVGGKEFVGFMREDQKTYLRAKRQRNLQYGYLFNSGSKFSSDLKACIYDYENEHELIEAWNSLIDKYNLQENEWMKRTWRKREQWERMYMKWIVVDKRYEEVSAIYDSRQKLPRMKLKKSPILIQVANLYTPLPIFDLFHYELDTFLCCQVKQFHVLEREVKCVIGLYGKSILWRVGWKLLG
ncbi:hypothetical protein ACSBR1_032435 [Camellia fascicularis]